MKVQFKIIFFVVLGFELRAYLEPLHQTLFCEGFYRDGVLQTICPGWLRTMILLIAASSVARITGMRQRCLAQNKFGLALAPSIFAGDFPGIFICTVFKVAAIFQALYNP
jgi:hypothetical protein